jgi:glyoxylase-like metal-dependent hydrolase (beta-lactamase superfamily II)
MRSNLHPAGRYVGAQRLRRGDRNMVAPRYEIYAIKYGERTGTRQDTFIDADPHDGPLPMDYFIWAIRSPEHVVVVDVGFSRQEGERRGREFHRGPDEGLALIGIDAKDVKDVIITHMHYDHAGNLELFPNACFHIQDSEVAFVTGRAMTHKWLRDPFHLPDVLEMVSLVYGDRVVFHDGAQDVLPGITVHPMPGHTRGLQSVTVNTNRGTVAVASDAAHYYESLETEVVFTTHENAFELVESYRRLKRLVPSDDHIIPGHDPRVLQRYPPATPELAGIVARVDPAPPTG